MDRCGSLWVVPGFSNYGVSSLLQFNVHVNVLFTLEDHFPSLLNQHLGENLDIYK